MFLFQLIEKSAIFNGVTRVRTHSGDMLEGKFNGRTDEGYFEFNLSKGGTAHINPDKIESVTLLDNLQLLEEASGTNSL